MGIYLGTTLKIQISERVSGKSQGTSHQNLIPAPLLAKWAVDSAMPFSITVAVQWLTPGKGHLPELNAEETDQGFLEDGS